MGFIDADAHVDETVQTWDYIDPELERFRPVLFDPPGGNGFLARDDRPHGMWLIGGNVRLKRYRSDQKTGTTVATRELFDIPARLRDMDALGIDVQVLYGTMFIHAVTDHADVEYAVHSSYNRWLADRTASSGGRLKWAYLPPVLSMDKAVAGMKWAKEHGACAVAKKGVEYNRTAADPMFFPLYEEAERLGLPVCFHTGDGDLHSNAGEGASMQHWAVIAASAALLNDRIPQRFPGLRWGFVEAGATWVPEVLKLVSMRGRASFKGDYKSEFLRANNIYITCDTEDDIPFLVNNFGGADYLMIGTDYSHQDLSAELHAHRAVVEMGDKGDISPAVAQRIVETNGRVLYAL